jgi:Uma2 family endonuclease
MGQASTRALLPDAELRTLTPSRHIMVMAAALRQFTVEDVEAFPYDGNRYELLHGLLLVTPQPGLPHQVVATRLMLKLGLSLVDEPTVQLYAPGTVQIRPSIHLEPDLLIGSLPGALRWDAMTDHWLAVEVSGAGSRVYDRDYKRDGYLGIGVKEVWLADLKLQRVLVSKPGGEKDVPHDTVVTWRSPGGREIKIDVQELFRGLTPEP